MSKLRSCVLALIGFSLRFAIIHVFKDSIRPRVEVSTPVSGWKRAYEAVFLLNSGLDPYSGNIFHEYPVSLQFYKIIISYLNIDLVYAVTDTFTAILLKYSVHNQILSSGHREEDAKSKSNLVYIIYLFSPISILSCAGTPTSLFTNFLIALITGTLHVRSFRALTCVLCAFLSCNNIHFSTLTIPIFLCQEYCSNRRNGKSNSLEHLPYYKRSNFSSSITVSTMISLTTVATLMATSYLLMGKSWSFLNSSYLDVMKISDLTPNIGMFWYLFTEMFESFLPFFIWVVQINAFIHVIPLSISLRDKPFFALYITLLTSAIFQPYLSLPTIAILTSLLPQWSELFANMRYGLIICCAAITSMTLLPIFWHLWIVMGTANSNFYFGATLAFTTSLIVLMVDLLLATSYAKAKLSLEKFKNDCDGVQGALPVDKE